MVGTACASHFMSIPLARSSFVAGSKLIRPIASSMVIVGDGFSSRLTPVPSEARIEDWGNTKDVAGSSPNARFVKSEQKLTKIKNLTNLGIGCLHCRRPTPTASMTVRISDWTCSGVQWFFHENSLRLTQSGSGVTKPRWGKSQIEVTAVAVSDS
jgi:hypothetical protein